MTNPNAGFPDPLTPSDCDLRGMPFMPIEISRVLDSNLYALSTGDEFKAAFTLWCKAFLQIPAGSLPDDDRILAHLSSAGLRWPKVRNVALKGWIKCSDGRLYHRVVSEKALTAWEGRKSQRSRTEAARAARLAKSKAHQPEYVDVAVDNGNVSKTTSTSPVTSSVTEIVTGSKGEGERESKKKDSDATHLPPALAIGVIPDAKTLLFRDGLKTLMAMSGRSDQHCRSFIGKMLQGLQNDAALVHEIILDCETTRPAVPTEWLAAAVKARIAPKGKPEAFGHHPMTEGSEYMLRVLAGEIDEHGNPKAQHPAPAPSGGPIIEGALA